MASLRAVLGQAWNADRNKSLSATLYRSATLDPDACLKAWKDQIGWFDQWMFNTTGDESLWLELDACSLVRESPFRMWTLFPAEARRRAWPALVIKPWTAHFLHDTAGQQLAAIA